MSEQRYDVAIVGAGIVGLAHARAAARRGLSVVVIDRDARANGASVRNFGFVTVTGQAAGATWQRARRSREIWAEIAADADIPILHRGLYLPVRSPLAVAVLEEFMAGEMAEGCELLGGEAMQTLPVLPEAGMRACLFSPHELRIEARTAVPRLAAWLGERLRVAFRRGVTATAVAPPFVETGAGVVHADRVVVCPGPDLVALYPEVIAAHEVTLCKLQMLRTVPQAADFRLPGAVMNELSLVRYGGYAACPSAGPLRAELMRGERASLDHGIHLIAVQSADGSLVIGDSHHYGATPDPFQSDAVEQLMLRHARENLPRANLTVSERWVGVYPASERQPAFIAAPDPSVRLVMVTGGTGMSTAFALAEEVFDKWT